jgi:hypothetical protein
MDPNENVEAGKKLVKDLVEDAVGEMKLVKEALQESVTEVFEETKATVQVLFGASAQIGAYFGGIFGYKQDEESNEESNASTKKPNVSTEEPNKVDKDDPWSS